MSKEEPTLGIVGVRMGLGVLVMNPVVTAPLVDAILEGDGLEEGEEEAERELGLV